MFDTYVREPLRTADLSDDERAERLVEAFRVLLPSVTALVGHHFRRCCSRSPKSTSSPSASPPSWRRPTPKPAVASRWCGRDAPAPATQARLPEGDDKHRAVEAMFDRIAPRYDRLNRIISLGQDRRWRRHTVGAPDWRRARPCSISAAAPAICATSSRRRVTRRSVSTSPPACWPLRTRPLRWARRRAALPVPDASTDGVVSGFAPATSSTSSASSGSARPSTGARLAALETAEPAGPLLRAGHNIWFRRVVPFVGATLAHDAEAYDYLPRSTAYLPPADDLLALVEAAGFYVAPHVHCGRRPADHGHTAMTATSIAAGLVARTREVEPPGDLLDSLSPDGFAWLTDGSGFVTSESRRGSRRRRRSCPRRHRERRPGVAAGTGAIAVSSLPFRGAAQGELVIPASVTGLESDGRAWHTDIGSTVPFAERGAGAHAPAWKVGSPGPSGRPRCTPSSRRSRPVSSPRPCSPARSSCTPTRRSTRAVVDRLRATQGGCVVFAAGGNLGATPELLVRRRTAVVPADGRHDPTRDRCGRQCRRGRARRLGQGRPRAPAGRRRGGGRLRAFGVDITSVRGPDVARLATVSHLATTIAGTVEPRSASSALELALRLHPTPAVAGAPRRRAGHARRPRDLRPRPVRGRSDGSTRTGTANGRSPCVAPSSTGPPRASSRAGVVAGSDPDAEWAETQAKLEPMLRVLVQP